MKPIDEAMALAFPNHEFWKRSTEEALRELGGILLSHGEPPELVADALASIYHSVSEEYGS